MTTIEVQVPDSKAQKYKVLFQALARKDMSSEDFEDAFLSMRIDEVVSNASSDYIDSTVFLKNLGKSLSS